MSEWTTARAAKQGSKYLAATSPVSVTLVGCLGPFHPPHPQCAQGQCTPAWLGEILPVVSRASGRVEGESQPNVF